MAGKQRSNLDRLGDMYGRYREWVNPDGNDMLKDMLGASNAMIRGEKLTPAQEQAITSFGGAGSIVKMGPRLLEKTITTAKAARDAARHRGLDRSAQQLAAKNVFAKAQKTVGNATRINPEYERGIARAAKQEAQDLTISRGGAGFAAGGAAAFGGLYNAVDLASREASPVSDAYAAGGLPRAAGTVLRQGYEGLSNDVIDAGEFLWNNNKELGKTMVNGGKIVGTALEAKASNMWDLYRGIAGGVLNSSAPAPVASPTPAPSTAPTPGQVQTDSISKTMPSYFSSGPANTYRASQEAFNAMTPEEKKAEIDRRRGIVTPPVRRTQIGSVPTTPVEVQESPASVPQEQAETQRIIDAATPEMLSALNGMKDNFKKGENMGAKTALWDVMTDHANVSRNTDLSKFYVNPAAGDTPQMSVAPTQTQLQIQQLLQSPGSQETMGRNSSMNAPAVAPPPSIGSSAAPGITDSIVERASDQAAAIQAMEQQRLNKDAMTERYHNARLNPFGAGSGYEELQRRRRF